jgi:hypothetical protein
MGFMGFGLDFPYGYWGSKQPCTQGIRKAKRNKGFSLQAG